ncbi:MAG TPA: ABC transporter ATP-binding protein [Actinomycetota bacterium]|nr:ABC transporter ATP-binding protein [Actinomycetota bacterium]
MLEGQGVVMRFGGIVAVDGVDLRVEKGEIRCIIGPNGAGKTTLFNVLTGDLRPTAGRVMLEGQRIDGLPVHKIARMGVARKFQVPAVFRDLTVLENLQIAANGTRRIASLLRRDRNRDEAVDGIAKEVGLDRLLGAPAAHLAHGDIQRLEIGMVLVEEPRVLLLDEPTAGMTFDETRTIAVLLRDLAERRALTMVIVEHDIDFIKMIGDRITVLHKGKVLMEGQHTEVEQSEEVRRVYLGEGL